MPHFYEEYLRAYFDKPKLKLKQLLTGFNVNNGYDYVVLDSSNGTH